MPVEKSMRGYRTTETEKSLGHTSNHIVIDYLKSVKNKLSDVEVKFTELQKKKQKKIAKTKAKIEAWHTKYQTLSENIIRAELSNRENTFPVPSPISEYASSTLPRSRRVLGSFEVSIKNEKHQKELAKLLSKQPTREDYFIAEMLPSRRAEYQGTFSNLELIRRWLKNIDSLIAELESRTKPTVYTAQAMEIRYQAEQGLKRFIPNK